MQLKTVDIFSEAWRCMRDVRMEVMMVGVASAGMVVAISMFMNVLEVFVMNAFGASQYLGSPIFSGPEDLEFSEGVIVACLAAIVLWSIKSLFVSPLFVGLRMLCVGIVKGEGVDRTSVARYYPRAIPILKAKILAFAFICIGLMFFIVPGVYLYFAFSMAPLLVADKGMGSLEALAESARAVNKVIFKYLLVCLLLLAVNLFALAFTFGVALMWVFPWSMAVLAIYYRELFLEYSAEKVA